MSATYSLSERRSGGVVLSIHFDVPGSEIELATFITTARSVGKVIEALSLTYFEGSIEFHLSVLPPEEGSFRTRLGVWTASGAMFLAGTLSDGIASGVIKALTGHDHAYWAEQATKVLMQEFSGKSDPELEQSEREKKRQMEEHLQSQLLTMLTVGFLSKRPTELERLGITPSQFDNGFSARNEFYTACIENRRIAAIGFSDRADFPITRDQFTEMISTRPPADESNTWHVEIASISVISPVWVQDDKKRTWKGRDESGKERFFTIEDAHFWSLVQGRRLDVDIFDRMLVQWVFLIEGGKPKSFRVLRVLEYNSIKLAEPYDDATLEGILGTYRKELNNSNQLDLFCT